MMANERIYLLNVITRMSAGVVAAVLKILAARAKFFEDLFAAAPSKEREQRALKARKEFEICRQSFNDWQEKYNSMLPVVFSADEFEYIASEQAKRIIIAKSIHEIKKACNYAREEQFVFNIARNMF